MKTISILGCGWLGFPLAKALIYQGWAVNGSTTKTEKKQYLTEVGIDAFRIVFNPGLVSDDKPGFFDADSLFVNIPPKLRKNEGDFHLQQIRALTSALDKSRIKDLIFISSTSVYPDLNREVTEKDADPAHVLVKAENLLTDFCQSTNRRLIILRCGGLMGYDRIPCKYYSGKKGVTNGQTPVNYIHQDDVIGAVSMLLGQNTWNRTFNLVAPLHPVRKDVISDCCNKTFYNLPEFVKAPDPEPFKIVSVTKFLETTSYSFKYPNPLDFEYHLQ